MKTTCGTPEYVAPEVVTKNEGYGLPADIWSVGVMLFILLSGEQPFHSDREGQNGTRHVLDQVKRHKSIASKYAENEIWDDISDSAKELLDKGMLARDPSQRLTAAELLEHPWITGETTPITPMAKTLLRTHKIWLRRKFRVAIFTLVATNRIRALVHSLKATQLVEADGMAELTIETHYSKLLVKFIEINTAADGCASQTS